MVTRPFPQPGRLVEAAYRQLYLAGHGTPDQRRAAGSISALDRPWDPPSCSPPVRAQVWAWLDQVAAWVNHEYAWAVGRLIPACWPAHPHIAHELAVLADLRRAAGLELGSPLLEDWHRYSLPMFLDRMHDRLANSCATAHQDWPAAARHRSYHNEANRRDRAAWFADDLESGPPPSPGWQAPGHLALVDLSSGEAIDPGPPKGGR